MGELQKRDDRKAIGLGRRLREEWERDYACYAVKHHPLRGGLKNTHDTSPWQDGTMRRQKENCRQGQARTGVI